LPRAPKVRGLMSCRLLRSVDPLSNPRYAPQSIQLLALSLSAADLHDFGEALAVWKTGAAGLAPPPYLGAFWIVSAGHDSLRTKSRQS
jgi:hypothetical protein